MRAGDHVLHRPTGETWVVAFVDGDDLAACGWPFSIVPVSDCSLVKACTDAKHIERLHELAASTGMRASRAKAELEKLGMAA
jgi:hypothetical protein